MRITLEKALELLSENIAPLPPRRMSASAALGLMLAEPLEAQTDQPPFPRSPYDGYALRAADIASAGKDSPAVLKVVGRSFAGVPAGTPVGEGEAVRIMTGAAIPEGADCVIMQEQTDEGEDTVEIYRSVKPFDNYCRAGEDFTAGQLLAPAGVRVTAAVSAVAASAGITEITAYPRPLVTVLSTGNELEDPGKALAFGKIYSSNNVLLSARLKELELWPVDMGHVDDETYAIAAAIDKAATLSELVITTGGVSVGQKDLVPAALQKLGAQLIFHGVDMKPGMPAAFAIYKGKPILSLSGNPFAAAVTFELLGRRALSILSRDEGLLPAERSAALAREYTKKRPCRRFLRATLKDGLVSFPAEQGNGQLRSMIGTNCLAHLPAGEEPIPAGAQLQIYMLEDSYYAVQSL